MAVQLMRWVISWLLCVLANFVQAELVPYPESSIVAQGVEAVKSRGFILGAVETRRRETSIERLVDVVSDRRWTTYEVPTETDAKKLKAHYAAQLAGHILFQCEGRDCGRSNTWANQIFGQAVLYGRDQDQSYFAAQVEDQLVSVYLIKRGNRRQYAHVEVWQPEVMPPLVLATADESQWQAWLAEFTRTGFAVIPQVQPMANGELSISDLALLANLAASIPESLGTELQLVCHLYQTTAGTIGSTAEPTRDLAELLAGSTRCAEDATAVFADAGRTVTPRGVGPLAPNEARPRSRLVLLAPNRLVR